MRRAPPAGSVCACTRVAQRLSGSWRCCSVIGASHGCIRSMASLSRRASSWPTDRATPGRAAAGDSGDLGGQPTSGPGAVWMLVLVVMAAAAAAVAIRWPLLLLYVYCAAIPFNFALPPGPAGTVARIAGLAFFVGYLLRRPDALRPGILPIVGWAFVAWTLASCLWAGDPETAFEVWLSLAQLFAISVLVASIVASDPGIVRPALWAYALAAAATAAIGSVSYLQSRTIYLDRAVAFSGQDPALFASIILPAIVFLMWEVQSRTSRAPVRLAALAALLVCVAGLALSGTRSGWIGIIAAAIAWLALGRERRQAFSLAAAALAIVLLATAVPGMGDFLLGRVESSFATGGSGRTDIWSVGLYMFGSAPLIGVGFGNFAGCVHPLCGQPGVSGFRSDLRPVRRPGRSQRAARRLRRDRARRRDAARTVRAVRGPARGRLPDGQRRPGRGSWACLVQSMFLDILGQKQLWLFLAIAFGLGVARRAVVDVPAATGRGRRLTTPWSRALKANARGVRDRLPTPP